jgi:hypothetical protein
MTFFDDRNYQPSDGSAEPPGGRRTDQVRNKANVDLLIKELLSRFGTLEAVAKQVGVHRITLIRWRDNGASPEAVERLRETLARSNARTEMTAQGYTVHGEAAEPAPVQLLKQLVSEAISIRSIGLEGRADRIDETVVALADELKDYYPPALEGKFLAIKATSQTGMGQLDDAIATYASAIEAMRAAKNDSDAYRYTLSRAFLEVKRAWAARSSRSDGALLEVIGRSRQLVESVPEHVTPAALRQRYGVLLTILAMVGNAKDEFRSTVRALVDDFYLYGSGVEEAKAAVREIVANNKDGEFDVVLKENWLSILKTF